MAGVAGSHHVVGIKHLLGELRYSKGCVLLGAPGSEGSKPRNKEVETGEGDHVEVNLILAREPEAGCYTRHGEGHQVVQVSVSGVWQLQGPKRVYELD